MFDATESSRVLAGSEPFFPYAIPHHPAEAQRRFEEGRLPDVTRFVRQFEAIPPPLSGGWTELPNLQPIAELRVRDDAFTFIRQSGLGAHDRLFVHIGRTVYRGALVIAVRLVREGDRPFVARVMKLETEEQGPVLQIGDRYPPFVLAARGTVRVECVIFNRPDVLCRSSTMTF